MTVTLAPFGPLVVAHDEAVLTPRPWTLAQSRWAVELLDALPPGPVLELGCGVGHIGLVVALETGRRVVQVDDDAHACELAQANASRAGVVTDVRCAPAEAALTPPERFPLVLADPPYLRSGHLGDDPPHTVDGGPDGLDLARRWLAVAAEHLTPEGMVLLQLGGPAQVDAVAEGLDRLALQAARHYGADRSVALLTPCHHQGDALDHR